MEITNNDILRFMLDFTAYKVRNDNELFKLKWLAFCSIVNQTDDELYINIIRNIVFKRYDIDNNILYIRCNELSAGYYELFLNNKTVRNHIETCFEPNLKFDIEYKGDLDGHKELE